MNTTEQLMKLNKESLVKLVKQLYLTNDNDYVNTIAPQGYSHESNYKDAIYSGMIDVDMEMSTVDTSLANITIDGWNITLDGDKISLLPYYKRIDLKVNKKWTIRGPIKSEIAMCMIDKYKSIYLGEYKDWNKYLVQYKDHTLVININNNNMATGIKLLQHDRMAKEMYQKRYNKKDVEWNKVEMTSEVYGDIAVGIPHEIDNIIERVETALEFLESTGSPEIDNYIKERLLDMYE